MKRCAVSCEPKRTQNQKNLNTTSTNSQRKRNKIHCKGHNITLKREPCFGFFWLTTASRYGHFFRVFSGFFCVKNPPIKTHGSNRDHPWQPTCQSGSLLVLNTEEETQFLPLFVLPAFYGGRTTAPSWSILNEVNLLWMYKNVSINLTALALRSPSLLLLLVNFFFFFHISHLHCSLARSINPIAIFPTKILIFHYLLQLLTTIF